jgi:signal transduction histidine kinase
MVQDIEEKKIISEPISIVAHQLKNPISVIKGYLEILIAEDEGKINEKQREYLTDAFTNVQNAISVIREVLDVAMIEEDRYALKSDAVDLVPITHEAIANYLRFAKASNCEIVFNEIGESAFVYTDATKIRQVVENFISNAIKYKSPGRGKVDVKIVVKDDEILFSCRDNGVGIPQEDFDRVFSKFYRSEKSLDIDPSGTGLGLSINKAIVELSGGKIWFTKNADQGTTFHFSLPSAKKKVLFEDP